MSAKQETSREGSRMTTLRRWLEANPGEVLSAHDCADRFGWTVRQAKITLWHLKKAQVIASATVYWINPGRER